MLIDTHAHLDMTDFDRDRGAVIERALNGGVNRIVSVGIDRKSSADAIGLARQYGCVKAAIGYHPHHAEVCTRSDLDDLVKMVSEPAVVAWGEIGLDFYRGYAALEAQEQIFETQVKLARDLNLPVIIHDREAHEAVYSVLKKMGKGDRRGVIHCFSGDVTLAQAFMDLGYYISIPGTVTYKKAVTVQHVAASLPLDRLLVETDAPYLAPVPKRGKRNEPFFVTYTAQEVARLRGLSLAEVARQTTKNAEYLFGLEEWSR
ncbi:MAG: TatD family hydrolase [Thermodesulfobacteriota bacterium]